VGTRYFVSGRDPKTPHQIYAGKIIKENHMPEKISRGLKTEPQNALTRVDCFLMDFSECPQIYERLLQEAKKHFRSPQQQAIYYIDNGINGAKINIIGPRIELVGQNADPDQ
jgi:hypothetical protein